MEIKVSIGEIMDKFTILEIKKERIHDPGKLKHVILEYNYLDKIIHQLSFDFSSADYQELYNVNLALWDIEDKIRDKERKKEFGNEFIELARKIYFLNDKRAEIKKRINLIHDSEIVEEKSYEIY